ncbi:MAG: hypothetical protein H6728_03780 [Myxococcales bacterium]|nr:hypothetical protein [Myxococcales bacterium]
MRFQMHAQTLEEVEEYFLHRAIQSLHEGWDWDGKLTPLTWKGETWGMRAMFQDAEKTLYQSVYVLDQHTGKGHFSRYIKAHPTPIVTAPDCHVEEYLQSKDIPYKILGKFTQTPEYRIVAEKLDDRYAQRSKLHYMNHIDEGLAVLVDLGASEQAMRAFTLHVLFQADADLAQHAALASTVTEDPYVLLLALEYRNIANAYLSKREIQSIEEIALSPLPEVNDMLRADKVQNYKDFLLYHKGTHPRSEALERYFHNWLARLDISLERFDQWKTRLDVKPHLQRTPPLEA